MPTKTKAKKTTRSIASAKASSSISSKANHGEWKNLVQGFVENVFEQFSDNVSQKVHAWIRALKRKTVGSILIILGIVYLVVGLAEYMNSVFSLLLPGLGYFLVGILVILTGYLLSSDK